ncbi:MAG: hypothetical protein IV100_34850 [Myxococcales bacterium]|nr:hypothetical protein [Myxococcales bacterium]
MNDPLPEIQRRLVYALLQPAITICRRLHVPLDVVEQLCRLAYYEQLRGPGGATQAEAAEILGRSIRTVVNVERLARTDFLAPENEVRDARRIEEALALGSLTAGEMSEATQLLLHDVERMLVALAGSGRALAATGDDGVVRYSLVTRHQSLVQSDLLPRIDGLRHQLEVLTAAVVRRFFGASDQRPTMARTLAFLGRPEDVQAFGDELIRTLRRGAVDVEEHSLQAGEHDRYAVTFALTPIDPEPSESSRRTR